MTYFWRAPATAVAVLLSGLILGMIQLYEVDVLRILSAVVAVLYNLEPYEVDDLLVVCVLLGGGGAIDAMLANRRRTRALEIQEQRLRVLKATMRTVHDIVNNGLNNLQLFRLEADGVLPPESLALFDQLIAEMAARLQVLSDLDDTPERPMATGTGIDYTPRAPGQGPFTERGRDTP